MRAAKRKLCPWPAPAGSGPSHMPRRVFDPAIGMYAVRLHPGDYYATAAEDETITTVLGSCVAACIRNPQIGYGGMNHFMLPQSDSGEWAGISAALRYGNHAMEVLINAVLKTGCAREDLEIKLFGGADFTVGLSRVGEKNARFALHYIEHDGLHAASVDLGGSRPRVLQYAPSTGKVKRKLLERPTRRILEEDRQAEAKITTLPEGAVELFT
jgi:chemotaxis protein CheD